MKALLTFLTTSILAFASMANEMHVVPTNVRESRVDSETYRGELSAEFRDIRVSLVIVMKKGRVSTMEGVADGKEFTIDVRRLPALKDLRFKDLVLLVDCCINGAAFSWYMPTGVLKRCPGSDRAGRAPRVIRRDIAVRVSVGDDAVAYVFDRC